MQEVISFLKNPAGLALIAACLPLLTFLEISFFGKRGRGAATAIGYIWLSFLLSVYIFITVWGRSPQTAQLQWFTIGDVTFTAGVLLNDLSVLMLLLISFVALLVHIFSVGYMENDPNLHRYWSYLGIFCFSMMALVIVDNLLLLYFFWELVGLSSYLLIGFWTSRDAAGRAAKKAFLMNRIGDLGFLAGMLILYAQFHTLDLQRLFSIVSSQGPHLFDNAMITGGKWISSVNQLPSGWLTAAGIGFFLGAMAKSAQFPLHTWLPDAMEGPTPVSSLIHAATMVAAGVFLIVRIFPVFNPDVRAVIALTGGVTAFFAATCAVVQFDIKKILAWSTISQLGLMMLAAGVGATGQALFHLVAHAFFKCLLFLGAGSVIHALHHDDDAFDPQDLRNMGGLRKKMPVTAFVMIVAGAALAGLPFTSGYFSKDGILMHVVAVSNDLRGTYTILPFLALTSSLLTAFYVARLIFAVFFGEERPMPAVHDPKPVMKWPMLLLAAGCFYPLFTGGFTSFGESWVSRAAGIPPLENDHAELSWVPLALTAASGLLILAAWLLYGRRRAHLVTGLKPAGVFLLHGWHVDRLYRLVFVGPAMRLATIATWVDHNVLDGIVNLAARIMVVFSAIACWFDTYVVDGLVNVTGTLSRGIGNVARRVQSGKVQHYLFFTLAVLLLFFIIHYFSW